jgi:hypothetical protein
VPFIAAPSPALPPRTIGRFAPVIARRRSEPASLRAANVVRGARKLEELRRRDRARDAASGGDEIGERRIDGTGDERGVEARAGFAHARCGAPSPLDVVPLGRGERSTTQIESAERPSDSLRIADARSGASIDHRRIRNRIPRGAREDLCRERRRARAGDEHLRRAILGAEPRRDMLRACFGHRADRAHRKRLDVDAIGGIRQCAGAERTGGESPAADDDSPRTVDGRAQVAAPDAERADRAPAPVVGGGIVLEHLDRRLGAIRAGGARIAADGEHARTRRGLDRDERVMRASGVELVERGSESSGEGGVDERRARG